jgi:hypothetical protein
VGNVGSEVQGLTIGELCRLCDVSPVLAKRAIENLKRLGLIAEIEHRNGRVGLAMVTVDDLAAEAAAAGVELCRDAACPLRGPHYHPEPDPQAPHLRSAMTPGGLVIFTDPAVGTGRRGGPHGD